VNTNAHLLAPALKKITKKCFSLAVIIVHFNCNCFLLNYDAINVGLTASYRTVYSAFLHFFSDCFPRNTDAVHTSLISSYSTILIQCFFLDGHLRSPH